MARWTVALTVGALLVAASWCPVLAQNTNGNPGTGDINLNNNNAVNANTQGTYTGSNQNSSPNPGSTLAPITRPEAEAMLAPPIPIVNVSNPATVYNSGDELIRAAVQDWLSTIKEPHDKWGNVTNSIYVNAYCPDKLPSALLNHIVNYTKGRRMIALSAAHALSLAQAQQQFRENIIRQIMQNGRPGSGNTNGNANANANANTNVNTNGSSNTNNGNVGGGNENVPSLNNNNSGNNNQPANNNNTPAANNNNAPANNNNTPATNNNNGSGGSLESQIEQKYGVDVQDLPKSWTEQELQYLDEALSKLPKSWVQGHVYRRASSDPGMQNTFGVTDPNDPTKGIITMFDLSFDSRYSQTDFPCPPWTEEESHKYEFMSTIVHESTHLYQIYAGQRQRQDNYETSAVVQNWAQKFGWSYDSGSGKWAFDPNRYRERPSNYAMSQTNPHPMEDMAESMMFYCFDPARLRMTQTAPGATNSRYDFCRDVLGVPESTGLDPTKTAKPPGF